MKDDKIYLYGRNALTEALATNPKILQRVFLTEKLFKDKVLIKQLESHQIMVTEMNKGSAKNKVGADAVHQGVIAVLSIPALYTPLESVLQKINLKKNPLFLLLDELQDPHNVGALIRSAVAFGAEAVLLPEHNQVAVTGAVIKTSAGMVFKIPIVKIGNVNNTIRTLKDKGFWIYGLIGGGDTVLSQTTFDTPSVIIVGNEGFGVRQKTMELCDIKLSIPISEKCESLNAATAGAVAMYEWSRNKK